jgi:hypothetical protein
MPKLKLNNHDRLRGNIMSVLTLLLFLTPNLNDTRNVRSVGHAWEYTWSRSSNEYKILKPRIISIQLGPIMRGIFNLIVWLASSLYYLTSVQASLATNVERRNCRTSSDPSCHFLLQRCAVNVCILNLPFPVK